MVALPRSMRSSRPITLVMAVCWFASSMGWPSAKAQFPQPKLTSLSRAGVRAGESAEVTLRGTDLEGPGTLWFDHPGLGAVAVKDQTFRISAAANVPLGQHDVRYIGTFGVSNPRTFLVGDRPESVELEPNNSPDKATPIAFNSVAYGEISAATEIDCFAFEGKKGQRVFLDIQAERIDSRLDATARVLGPSGVEIAESRDVYGTDPFLDMTLPLDGRYVIKLHDATYAGSPDHTYRLVVHDGPHLDSILPMAAQPGTTGSFTVIGRGLGAGAISDPSLKVDGRELERISVAITMPATLPNLPRIYTPPASAVIRQGLDYSYTRLDPSGAAPTTSDPLFIASSPGPIVVEKEPNDDGQPQMVTPPCDITGTFGTQSDVDVYRFQGHKGEVWWIETIAERQGSPADPALLIQKVGAKGRLDQDLANGDDLPDAGMGARFNTQSVDAAVRFQVPDDGLFQVVASDLYGSQRGDPRLVYRLLIRREQPDFRLFLFPAATTGPDSLTVRAGGRTLAYVAAARRDGFAGPIRVEATELPKGVGCSPVVIGPGQVSAPIVFEAAEDARTTGGTISLIGQTRFGDRKEDLKYVSGATTLASERSRPALSGGMTAGPNAAVPTVAPARMFRGFVMAVRGEPAPLTLSASPENWVVAQGRQVNLNLGVVRRAGFVEAVTVNSPDLPPNMPSALATIAKDAKTGILPLFVPKNVPVGTYTIVVRGAGPFPFNKDPKAKERPNLTLTEPSNPITITVRPAPLALTVNNKGGALKLGQQIEVEVNVARQNGYAGPVELTLVAPAGLKLTAAPGSLTKEQAKGKLIIKAAPDSPVGAAANVVVRASVKVRGETVEVDEPVGLTISK